MPPPHLPPPGDPFERVFPSLPILAPEETRRSDREKYGGLFYLGAGGLVIVLGLLGWFAWSAWSLRDVWSNVYILHEPSRPEADRLAAAYALAHASGVNQRQLWDIALRRSLPPLGRYVVAEALTAEAVADDPRGYTLAVARSEGWPDWLRLLLLRPMAYRAAEGFPLPPEPIEELARNPDPAIGLWASTTLAVSKTEAAAPAAARLRAEASAPGTFQPLAARLLQAVEAPGPADRKKALDDATLWLRDHHPGAAALWHDWEVRDGRLVPRGRS